MMKTQWANSEASTDGLCRIFSTQGLRVSEKKATRQTAGRSIQYETPICVLLITDQVEKQHAREGVDQ